MDTIRNFGIAFLVFLVIDLLWLGVVAKKLYAEQLGSLMKTNINWVAAIVFYLFFIAALLFFVINPALAKQSWQFALFAGLFFGLVAYMTYDLTNLATLKNWPMLLTFIDIAWGTVLAGATSILSYFLIRLF